MDIDEDRLEKTATAVRNAVEDNGLDATVRTTTDRREALEDADYVLNTIHVGGREPLENEIRIPERYGVRQAVGDTLDPGGVFRALRTAPVVLDIIGLCHSVPHTVHAIADYVDVDPDDIEYWVAGINHMVWFFELEHEGRDLYPDLLEAAADESIYRRDSVRFDLMEQFGRFVTESSHHLGEYVPYYRTEQSVVDDRTVDTDVEDASPVAWMQTDRYFEH